MATTEKMSKTTTPTHWDADIPVNYVYTYGLAGEAFFRAIKDRGTFLGTRCDACDITYVPPKAYCDRCLEALDKYIDVGTVGYVDTFTVSFKNMDGSEKPRPRILAMIKIEGTDGGIIHYLDGISIEEVALGLPVQAIFKPKAQRKGGIEDIIGFGPVKR
ncbi:MAG: Zn-ribbon domain-containing OB-fold protein [Candidatus Krumholzibacteria bacterium]|nr:Zn-ribbon domain-containing OB-fold protein [Candidatus Krumholzibacteria bacterium]